MSCKQWHEHRANQISWRSDAQVTRRTFGVAAEVFPCECHFLEDALSTIKELLAGRGESEAARGPENQGDA